MRPALAAVLLPFGHDGLCVGPQPVSLPPVNQDACGAAALTPLIGRPVADLPATSPWTTLRVIWPGIAVTEEFNETRLDAEVDESGVILRLSCG